MGYTLIIAEKPDAARRIAEALADKKPKVVKKREVEYYEFTVNGKKHVCVPAVGHLFTLSPLSESKKWSYPIFSYEWTPTYTKKGTEWTRKYFENIVDLAKGADEFIDAADVDTEGEVLLYNILRFICKVKDAKRMQFSTLTKDELVEAYRNMSHHILFPMLESGLTRHELDWLWGINLTRALTLALKNHNNKAFAILSAGRVQSPTLNLLLEREIEIRNFKPKPFWQLELRAKVDNQEIVAMHEKDKFWKKEEVDKVLNDCKGKDALVKDVKKREYKQKPPFPFNTTDLQAEAYACFKFSPTQTLQIAESLYQQGFISYPRSSSQKLPSVINYEKILKALASLKPYEKFAKELLEKEKLVPNEGPREDPAHPAIYATHEVPELSKLTPQQRKLYDLIVRRTLATFAEEALRESINAVLAIDDNKFIAVGKRTIKPGWTEIYSPYLTFEEQILPEIKVGQTVKVIKINLLSKQTQPPPRYTQGSIIKELEKRNLGTKATRAEILQTLYDRKYIFGKSIQVTKLGEVVAKTLKEFVPSIVSEELTRHFEEEMEEVFNGKKKREEVVEEAKEVLSKILKEFKSKEEKIGKKLLEGLTLSRQEERRLGICPNCKGELRILFSRISGKRFVGCSNYPKCKTGFPLPLVGQITSLNKNCEVCGLPMIQVWRKGKRPFRMCINPNCKTKESWNKNKS
ncbi:MAG: DNA topoisomerase I [Candidatus Aenigmatarchaeota archaeon]